MLRSSATYSAEYQPCGEVASSTSRLPNGAMLVSKPACVLVVWASAS